MKVYNNKFYYADKHKDITDVEAFRCFVCLNGDLVDRTIVVGDYSYKGVAGIRSVIHDVARFYRLWCEDYGIHRKAFKLSFIQDIKDNNIDNPYYLFYKNYSFKYMS